VRRHTVYLEDDLLYSGEEEYSAFRQSKDYMVRTDYSVVVRNQAWCLKRGLSNKSVGPGSQKSEYATSDLKTSATKNIGEQGKEG